MSGKDRELEIKLNNGNTVKVCPCCESWEQYDCYLEEKQVTVDIAEHFNEWLHGGDEPDEFETQRLIAETQMEWIKENQEEVFASIPHYEERAEDAMSEMDKYRCPLKVADMGLHDRMRAVLDDWCEENETDPDLIDPEEIIF